MTQSTELPSLQQQKAELRVLESQLREKAAENERLLQNFANLRESFEKVKNERTDMQGRCETLEKKQRSLQGRVRNLQKLPRKENSPQLASKEEENLHTPAPAPAPAPTPLKGPLALALRELLSWLANSLLEPLTAAEELPGTEALDCCLRLLPRVADLLQLHCSRVSGLQLDRRLHSECLLFLHFAFLLIERQEPAKVSDGIFSEKIANTFLFCIKIFFELLLLRFEVT